MRTRTQRVLLAASLALTCSCASQPKPQLAAAAPEQQLSRMRDQQFEQARRIEELEARIALLEADARNARTSDAGTANAGDSIRIGGAKELAAVPASAAAPESELPDQDDEARTGRRPHLRLYGKANPEPHESGRDASARDALPGVPAVSETLPVVPLPEQRAAQLRPAAVSGEGPLASYRAALRLLRERHYDEALAGFDSFITDNPRHALLPNAMYWRGEAHYAKREYAAALADFEALLERFPRGEKAADALLKTAFCLRQLGSEDKAREALRKLRSDFPNSQAATMASREGST